jgi:hypothetical protein
VNGEHSNSPTSLSTETISFLPQEVDALDMAFGRTKGLMPPRDSIPEEFDRFNGTWGNRLFNDWFYGGVKNLQLTPKPGIDKAKAMSHIRSIMGSFEPKHEHKETACAYLFDLWFDGSTAKWERAK